MKRNYELNELNECYLLNYAANAANETDIRTHSRQSRKIQFVKISDIREIRS